MLVITVFLKYIEFAYFSDEVQNLLETKVYLVFKNPKVAEVSSRRVKRVPKKICFGFPKYECVLFKDVNLSYYHIKTKKLK